MMLKALLFGLILCTVGCTKTLYYDLYPAHFAGEPKEEFGSATGVVSAAPARRLALPDEVLVSLPIEFQAAQLTGYITCLVDSEGGVYTLGGTPGDDGQYQVWMQARSSYFSELVQRLKEAGQLSFNPPGYPHIRCFRPEINPLAMFGKGWFYDWIDYLNAWQKRELELAALETRRTTLLDQLAARHVEISQVNDQIAALDQQIARKHQEIAADEERLARLKRKSGVNLLDSNTDRPAPPFNGEIEYDPEKDPFRTVQQDYLEDIRDRAWLDRNQSPSVYLDPDLVTALDRLHTGITTGRTELPENVRQALGATGFQLRVTSVSRTPWHQADTISSSASSGNLTARYDNSNHLFGQAVDISFLWLPGGRAAATQETLNSLSIILAHFGLHFPLGMADKVHITLSSAPESWLAQRVAMARAYSHKARELRGDQENAKKTGIFATEKLESQLSQLHTDLQDRLKERKEKANIFQRINSHHINIRAQIRKEEQRIDAERRQRDHDHNPWDVPRRDTPPGRPRPEPPDRPNPPRDRPDPPRNDGPGPIILG